jgi:hypothetical protein
MFGFIKTIIVGHAQRSSWGRAVTRIEPNGNIVDVLPKEYMATGFKVLRPRTLADYDICRRTVISESWRSNTFRYNYAGGRSLIPTLERALLELGTPQRHRRLPVLATSPVRR